MLGRIALRLLFHEKEKFLGAIFGVALALFLVILQSGFYFGYKRDTTVVLDAFDADFWIVPKNRPTFDGWDYMDDLPYWRVLSHPDVERATRLLWGYAPWRIPTTGGKDTVQVLGIDLDGGLFPNFGPSPAELCSLVRPDSQVLIAAKDRTKLGVTHPGQEGAEILGRRATIVGYIDKIHLFTTSGLVVTDLDNARSFLRIPPWHVSYIVAKCRAGANGGKVIQELHEAALEHSVYSSQDFHDLTSTYWESRTGIGPVLLLFSCLAVLVGFLILIATFYVSTVEKIPLFASMKALGASVAEIAFILFVQVALVFVLGCVLGGAGVATAYAILSDTTISIVIAPLVALTLTGIMAVCAGLAGAVAIRQLIRIEPGEAFRS